MDFLHIYVYMNTMKLTIGHTLKTFENRGEGGFQKRSQKAGRLIYKLNKKLCPGGREGPESSHFWRTSFMYAP